MSSLLHYVVFAEPSGLKSSYSFCCILGEKKAVVVVEPQLQLLNLVV
ncbi:hypothetical protein OROGR_025330 [Orobanche gracilis]